MAAAAVARSVETRCERAGPAGPSREGCRGGEAAGGEPGGLLPFLWSYSPLPARRIGKFAWGQELGDRLHRDGGSQGEGQRDRVTERQRDTQGEAGGTTSRAENGVRESEQPRARKSSGLEIPEAERERRASCRQKRAEAETEASARGDAGTRRERFGSVTVLPHLENITSPLKKKIQKRFGY